MLQYARTTFSTKYVSNNGLYTKARLVADNSKSTQGRQEAVHITITKSLKARTKHAYRYRYRYIYLSHN